MKKRSTFFIVHAVNNVEALAEALRKSQQDINWMLNNRQFLNVNCFDYIEVALTKYYGEKHQNLEQKPSPQ